MSFLILFLALPLFIAFLCFTLKAISYSVSIKRYKKLTSELDKAKTIIDGMDNAYEEYDYRAKERIDEEFPETLSRMKTLVKKLDNASIMRAFPTNTLVDCKTDWKILSKGLEHKCEMYSMNSMSDDAELKELIYLQRKASSLPNYDTSTRKRIDELSGALARRLSQTQSDVKIATNAIIEGNDALDRYQRSVFPRVEREFDNLREGILKAIKPRKTKVIVYSIVAAVSLICVPVLYLGITNYADHVQSEKAKEKAIKAAEEEEQLRINAEKDATEVKKSAEEARAAAEAEEARKKAAAEEKAAQEEMLKRITEKPQKSSTKSSSTKKKSNEKPAKQGSSTRKQKSGSSRPQDLTDNFSLPF